MNSKELKGIVDKITFRNNDNGYTVFKLMVGKDIVTCVGLISVINEGETVKVTGEYSSHSVYGEQFNVATIELSAPKTQLQILKFLSSGAIKGVGPATAIKIVEQFKDKTLDVIENHPVALTVIKGISEEKANQICDEYKKQYGIRDIMLTLAEFNITPLEATVIFKELGVYSIEKIRENPYLLCSDEIGFPFERAEEISEKLGVPPESDGRLSAGIEYILKRNLSNGHTCLPTSKLMTVAENLLSVNSIMIEDTLKQMCERMQIIKRRFEGEEYIFLYEYHSAEEYIASKIRALSESNNPMYPITLDELSKIENGLGFKFDDVQREAVNLALENNIFILTGGPGTGKTTTLNALIHILHNRKLSIALCAPTGRAAKRITELTGFEAKTLHRLLEVEWSDGEKQKFCRNKKNPLDENVIIIDEVSMVDTMLFKALLEACRISSRIIIVGDSDQLPSVGAGNVLSDLLSSGAVSSVRLTKIFRQNESSDIVKNAHKIISGEKPVLKNDSSDFFFIKNLNPDYTANTTVDLVLNRLPKAYGFEALNDIQVLCPSKKFICGSHNLNLLLQDALNPVKKNTKQLFFKGVSFRVGDKVMQTKNDYDIVWNADDGESGSGVFNGDIGTIVDVNVKESSLSVRYDNKVATYFEENLDIIELAYAVTVHKSQGSEFDCVVIPLCDTPKLLRYRNLIYTAITRAKKLIVFVGSEDILYDMIENDRKILRYSGLRHMLLNYEKDIL